MTCIVGLVHEGVVYIGGDRVVIPGDERGTYSRARMSYVEDTQDKLGPLGWLGLARRSHHSVGYPSDNDRKYNPDYDLRLYGATPPWDCSWRLAGPCPKVNGTRDCLRGETPMATEPS